MSALSLFSIELNYSQIDELNADENFVMYSIITGNQEAVEDIYLVLENDNYKHEFIMETEHNNASVFVERNMLPESNFYYYFRINFKDRTTLLYPENPALRMQNQVKLVSMKENYGYEVRPVYPQKTAIIDEEDFHIAVYVSGDHDKKGLILDDMDITEFCSIGENFITYFSDTLIEQGIHRINVTVNGFVVDEYGFTIKEIKSDNAFKMTGDIGVSGTYMLNEIGRDEFYADTLSMRSVLYTDLHTETGDNFFRLRTAINYNDFKFNDWQNRYSITYSNRYSEINLGDRLIMWNSPLNTRRSRGISVNFKKSLFNVEAFAGYDYQPNRIIFNNPYYAIINGISAGIGNTAAEMHLNIIRYSVFSDDSVSDLGKAGMYLHASALNNMIALHSNIMYTLFNRKSSSFSLTDISTEQNNYITNNIETFSTVSINTQHFFTNIDIVRKKASVFSGNLYNDKLFSLKNKIGFPVFENSEIVADYAYTKWDSLDNFEHQYGLLFDYHNEGTPYFNVKFTHKMPVNSSILNHIMSLRTDLGHSFTINDRDADFSLFVHQYTGNYSDTLLSFNKTGSGGSFSIEWSDIIHNNVSINMSGYNKDDNEISDMAFGLNTDFLFNSNCVSLNLNANIVNSFIDTLLIDGSARFKGALTYRFSYNHIVISAQLSDFLLYRNEILYQIPQIRINGLYRI